MILQNNNDHIQSYITSKLLIVYDLSSSQFFISAKSGHQSLYIRKYILD